MSENEENRSFGEKIKYDQLWNGPIEQQRKPTDSLHLLLLGIFLLIWLAIGSYAFSTGNVKSVIHDVGLMNDNIEDDSIHFVKKQAINFKSKYEILKYIALAAVITLAYIILLRWYAKFIVYTVIFILCSLLFGTVCISSYYYAENTQNSGALVLLVVSSIIFLSTVLLFLVCRKKIAVACEVIRESSKVVIFFPSSFLLPVVLFIVYVGIIIWTISICLYLSTNPQLSENDSQAHIYILHLINLYGSLWLLSFAKAFVQMILSGTFATWYWTMNKSYVPNNTVMRFCRITVRYHLGTLAYGSMILAICQFINILLKFLKNRVKDSCNPIFRCIFMWYKFLFANLERFLDYLNRNAYVMSAVHGTGFIQSAKDAFNLLMRNVIKVLIINKVTNCIFILGQLLAIGIATLAISSHCHNKGLHDEMAAATIAVVLGSLFITECFFMVLRSAIDTVFLCVMEDFERNDDSDEKPYYMSYKLKTLLLQGA